MPHFLTFLSSLSMCVFVQDTFLPHVECGTVTLIGATTENPSFQVNAALLSRCRVLVLEKLSVEAMGSILDRAVTTLGVKVRGQGTECPKDQDQTDGHEWVPYFSGGSRYLMCHDWVLSDSSKSFGWVVAYFVSSLIKFRKTRHVI